jgi:hypothetical protein
MAVPNAYMPTTGRVGQMFDTIRRVEVPDRFTNELLRRLGFTSSNDRPFIRVLKALRFLDDSGIPTERYRDYRNPTSGDAVLAEAIRDAYADVFFHDGDAHRRSASELTGIFQRESQKSERVSQQMAATFKALTDKADWSGPSPAPAQEARDGEAEADADADVAPPPEPEPSPVSASTQLGTLSLRHDVHLHLPETTNPAVYDAIFRSLRDHLL